VSDSPIRPIGPIRLMINDSGYAANDRA
jgi:hypothetical protein